MKTLHRILPLIGSIALTLPAGAVDIGKLQNTNALNLGTAWNGGVAPGLGDVMLWDALYTTPGVLATLSQLGGDMSVQGIRVGAVGGAVNAANSLYVGLEWH